MSTEEKAFESAVDGWIVGLLLFALLLPWLLVFNDARNGAVPTWVYAAVAGSNVYLFLLIGLVGWPIRYTITQDLLVVRSGIVRTRIERDWIIRIEPSRNPLSAPAASLDRLKIIYKRQGGGYPQFLLVSPNQREQFVRALGFELS